MKGTDISLKGASLYDIIILEVMIVRKEMEINGCIEVPSDMTINEFADAFLELIESKGWYFGGGFNEIVDGYYINPDGTKGESILED